MERMKAALAEAVSAQALLLPEIVELGDDRRQALFEMGETLSRLGLEIEDSVRVRSLCEPSRHYLAIPMPNNWLVILLRACGAWWQHQP